MSVSRRIGQGLHPDINVPPFRHFALVAVAERTSSKRSSVGNFGHKAVGSKGLVAEALDLSLPGNNCMLRMVAKFVKCRSAHGEHAELAHTQKHGIKSMGTKGESERAPLDLTRMFAGHASRKLLLDKRCRIDPSVIELLPMSCSQTADAWPLANVNGLDG